MSIKWIDNHHTDYIKHTNGLATLGSKDDDFAVVMIQGPAKNPTTIEREPSFVEELAALSTNILSKKRNYEKIRTKDGI